MAKSTTDADDFHYPGVQFPTYTQVPDEFFDRVMAHLSGAEWKVLMYLCRRTFGFKKQADTVSLSQICRGIRKRSGEVLDEGTGLATSTAVAALQGLERKGLIISRRNASKEQGHQATTYALRFVDAPSPKIEEGKAHPSPKIEQAPTENRTTLLRLSETQETVQQTDQQTEDVEARLRELRRVYSVPDDVYARLLARYSSEGGVRLVAFQGAMYEASRRH